MTDRTGLVTGFLLGGVVVSAAVVGWRWLGPASHDARPKPVPPAGVGTPLKEENVNAITLTPEATARLALQVAPIERKAVRPMRTYGGEVTVPPGQAVVVAAPVSGVLRALPAGLPTAGQAVKKGQPLLQLLPLLTPEGRANLASARIDADGQVKSAQTQCDAARIALDRARRVFQSDAGSKRMVDEAQAQFDLAMKALEAATARRMLLDKVLGEVEAGTAAPLTIDNPTDGLLRNVSVRPGQTVPAGAPLFEVVDLANAWVRVPVYVGDLPGVDARADAVVGEFVARNGEVPSPARPVAAPPSANAAAGTADLWYELNNRDGRHRPGQRVAVTLPLVGENNSLTLPWSAVVYDIHGGTWVYVQTGERAFVRRRVTVRHVAGNTAVLAAGPAAGTKVVTAGAAELFGTETGFTK